MPPPLSPDKLPTTISFDELSQLSHISLNRVWRNVKEARKHFFEKYFAHGLFQPKKDQYLLDWIDDGERYSTKGDRLPAINVEAHPSNNHLSFTDHSMAMIRHIIFVHKIPITRFPSLMNAFAVFFLGRALHLTEFPSISTLSTRLLRLDTIDWYYFVDKFKNYIQETTNNYGFQCFWYLMVDDSKLFKVNRHAVHMSDIHDEEGTPCYKLITTSAAVTKDSAGNSDLNYEMLLEKLPPEILAHYGGNVSDHASDALKEGRVTFEKLMNYIEQERNSQIEQHNQNPILSKVMNNVDRRIIQLGDPFHIDNLAVNAASIAAFGDTERDNHRQVHHRQLLQSIHDMFTQDRIGMQKHMDIILAGKQLKIKTMRERIQRWLANQGNASWVLDALSIKLQDGKSALIQWAMRIEKHTTSPAVRQIAKDVATMLMKPEVITGLHFESALGSYFEITLQWHAMPGELSKQSGFRIMELHLFWFEFIMPWWQAALTKPETHFKEMFKYINSYVKEEDGNCKLKIKQVKAGIQAGYNQIIKMTEMLFSPPNVFLVMLDPRCHGSFFRALLSLVLLEGGVRIGIETEELQKGVERSFSI